MPRSRFTVLDNQGVMTSLHVYAVVPGGWMWEEVNITFG